MGKLRGGKFVFDPADMVEKTTPTVIEPGEGDVPDPIFWSKACRQLGIPSEAQPFMKDGKESIRARIPIMPRKTYEAVLKRASFLVEREAQGLPTEQLPSGRWPDSLDEFADQVPVVIAQDKSTSSVYIDFGRPIQAIGVSPAMARTIATMIMAAANEMDPDGEMGNRPELINIARLKVPGMEKEQEGTVQLPGVFSGLKVPDRDDPTVQLRRPDDDPSVPLESFPLVGLCEGCHKPQYMTPGGESCGTHGGAPTFRPCWACCSFFEGRCASQPDGPGLDPAQNGNNDCSDWGINMSAVEVAMECGDDD